MGFGQPRKALGAELGYFRLEVSTLNSWTISPVPWYLFYYTLVAINIVLIVYINNKTNM